MNALEARTRRRLDEAYPCCTLSGVTIYRPDRFATGSPFGYEIDNLLHWQANDQDRLVIFECKDAPIRIASSRQTIPPENQEWYVKTPDGWDKNLKDQLFNQAESIWQNLCIPPTDRRRIEAIIVSSHSATPTLKCTMFTEQGLTLHVMSESRLLALLAAPDQLAAVFGTTGGTFLRIAQSNLLRLARQSVIVPELGHPEIGHGVDLIKRCRRTLDGRLFEFFRPTERRWAINGAAGMGKSVLLSYAITVLSTGKTLREIKRNQNDRTPMQVELIDFDAQSLKLPPVGERRIVVAGLKQRQLEVLQDLWKQFRERFLRHAENYLPDVQPQFVRWSPNLDLGRCNVLCVDEAHDLTAADQDKIAKWWDGNDSRYLVIAVDNHQRLRLASAEHEKWMLNGVKFAGCSLRLKRNYRCPTSVYAAALGLMFRWFAPDGVKVLPTKSELEDGFGFSVKEMDRRKGGRVVLETINDAHPANHWQFTVSRFSNTQSAAEWITASGLSGEDVLWLRFSEQDQDGPYDAEHLKRAFNYKALNSLDAARIIDSEIKGREFPIVVIEGLPRAAGEVGQPDQSWLARRQLYLCASRATGFLFFVMGETEQDSVMKSLRNELQQLLPAVAAPIDPQSASTKTWQFSFDLPETPRNMDVFLDDGPAQPVVEATVQQGSDLGDASEITIADNPEGLEGRPRRIHDVAKAIGWEPNELVGYLSGLRQTVPNVSHYLDGASSTRLIRELVGSEPPSRKTAIPINHSETATKDSAESSAPAVPMTANPPAESPAQDTPLVDSAVSQNDLISEKDFQRQFGQVRGWKEDYRRYLATAQIPPHLKRVARVADTSRVQSVPAPKVEVRQLASYLGVKVFHVNQVLMKENPGIMPSDLLDRKAVERVCRELGKKVPTHFQLVTLARIQTR